MKKFLTDNKIYFEILSSVLFGLAALLVSISAYLVSKEQLKVSEKSLEPLFFTELEYLKDKDTQTFKNSTLSVNNAGAPAYNIEVEVMEFFKLEIPENDWESIILPTKGYFGNRRMSNSPTGLTGVFFKKYNNEKFSTLANDFQEYLEDEGFIELETLVRIQYRNRIDDYGVVYILNGKRISLEEANIYINTPRRKKYNIHINSATPEKVLYEARVRLNNT